MADVLTRIVARKRDEVAHRTAPDAKPTERSLRAALARPGVRFIMEVKRKSPSGHVAAHSLERAVAAYAPVADAISVLVDGPDFGGSLDDVAAVRARFDGPILAKDFVVSAVQVREARAAGADAVLAMMSVLDDAGAAAVMAEARSLGMDVLVEVHDEGELARALAQGADLIGINNRDLATLAVDLATTERLAPLVPPGVVVVAESGIARRGDVLRLAPHADAFLVGSSLMASPDIGLAARELVFGAVKICGLTRVQDVALAAQAGASYAGFIFHPASPRRLERERARPLVAAAVETGLRTVGVFDAEDRDMVGTAKSLGLDSVQIHGPHDPAQIRSALGGIEIISVCSVNDGRLGQIGGGADRILFDHRGGGSGEAFDWSLLDGQPDLDRAFLAGGIGPANARLASAVGAHAIDCSSGVELAPGIKDPVKLRALFAALRPTGRSNS